MPLAPDQVHKYREILLEQRASLAGQVERLAENAISSTEATETSKSPLSMAENASDNYEQDFAFITMESEEELMHRIDLALRRMREGTYGECEECGVEIPRERLEALPFADLCIKCQQREERGLLNRGERGADAEEVFDVLDDTLDHSMAGDDA